MEKNKGKSRVVEDIDETALLQSVYEQGNPPLHKEPKNQEKKSETVPEQPKEAIRPKRGKQQDYEPLFIKESNVTARLGKTVYIRKEFHDRILRIIQVIGNNEVSLFSYIDNVLVHHFDSFQDEITESYNNKNSNNLF
jgi:Protein of unknown function (DUF3408).